MNEIWMQPFIVKRSYLDPKTGNFFAKGLWVTALDNYQGPDGVWYYFAEIHGKGVDIPCWNVAKA